VSWKTVFKLRGFCLTTQKTHDITCIEHPKDKLIGNGIEKRNRGKIPTSPLHVSKTAALLSTDQTHERFHLSPTKLVTLRQRPL